ncbi:Acetyltransferase (GNAT) family protein [Paenibacillus sp. UNCCL117]|uniref:GNAT family N-acetyltransferase n=1 Tax=unclassified Paenibacillus TaxID=185978 RepID=UPI000891EA17|nr:MULTISPECIES: GNAT family N-acetyltransferase [unclassified Paenibacillus]SDE55593.1 Acetyltransferase (GNAT) family protein [Paenibacillus sp. cl123]SFW66401.1 Acetyltransferase (GNAT) family protein [Paenibacillus sp. UNCCL117]
MENDSYPSNLVIRSAAVDDVDKLRDIFRRASLTVDGYRDLMAAHPEWLVWDDAMLPYARVAVAAGRIVGFASARPVDDFLELEDLFTDPDWMRQGVASRLIQDIARRGVRIEVTANPHAIGFYESVGFVVSGVAHTEGGTAPRMRRDAN